MNFNIDEFYLEETEKFFPAIPLSAGSFSDVGMRFRLNTFDANDSYIPAVPSTKRKFYDLTFFNSDTYKAPPRHKCLRISAQLVLSALPQSMEQ